MFAPFSNSSSINYPFLLVNPSLFVPFIGKVMLEKYVIFFFIVIVYKAIDMTLWSRRIWFNSLPITIFLVGNLNLNKEFLFAFYYDYYDYFIFFFLRIISLKISWISISTTSKFHHRNKIHRNEKKRIQTKQGPGAVFSTLLYLFPPRPGLCSWTESHSQPPHPQSLCKQITRVRENMISIFLRLYLHYGSRAGALMKFKDEWRPM